MLPLMNGRRAQVKAKIVCWNKVPCLIASFQNSNPPQVWQMDLEKLTSYSLKLVEKEGEWDLGYAVPDGVFTAVAHFDERPDAEMAYELVRRALVDSRPVGDGSGTGFVGRWVRRVLMLLGLVFVVIFAWNALSSSSVGKGDSEQRVNVGQERSKTLDDVPPDAVVLKTEPKVQVGVPVNADDVLPRGVE